MPSPHRQRRRPHGRYDPPSLLAARATALLLSVLFVALLVAVGFGLYSRFGGDAVRARVLGFDIRSDSLVRVELEVVKAPGSTAYCIIRSRGADGAEVGRAVVAVDARGSRERVVRSTHELTTRARAVTGEVGRCSAEPIPTSRPSP